MASQTGDRSRYFPVIQERYGQPIDYWWSLLEALESTRYADQMALLQAGHGFTKNHANAAVMAFRGSPSAQRFDSPEAYFQSLTPAHRALIEYVLSTVVEQFPPLHLVLAWNQPILRVDADYVLGLSASQRHVSINPFSAAVLADVAAQWVGYDVLGHTIRIPLDTKPDARLLGDLVTRRLAEIDQTAAASLD